MAEQDPTLAQNNEAASPQDQFKPGESQFGQGHPSGATAIGGDKAQQGSGDALIGGDQDQPSAGGLGQNQQSYGQSAQATGEASGQADVTTHDALQQSSAGIGARQGTLGPSPSGGSGQPISPATGGPDLSKGLSDQNR